MYIYIYIYIGGCRGKLKNQVIQSEEFNMKHRWLSFILNSSLWITLFFNFFSTSSDSIPLFASIGLCTTVCMYVCVYKELKNLDIPHRTPPYKSQHYMAYPKFTNQTSTPRPIISSIVSSTHKIACTIAKILTPLLGTVSPSQKLRRLT